MSTLNKTKLIWVAILVLWGLSEIDAYAESQQLTLDAVPGLQMVYEPFSGQATSKTWQLRLSLSNDNVDDGSDIEGSLDVNSEDVPAQRKLLLLFKPAEQQTFNLRGDQGALPLELLRGSRSQSPFILSNNEIRQEVFFDEASEEGLELDYIFRIPESVYAQSGLYSIKLDVEVFDLDNLNSISNTIELSLETTVEKKLQTNIAGTRGKYEDGVNFSVIDFESLQTNEKRKVFIQVRGNAQAKIKISSENNGRLKHKERRDTYIDYSITADNEFSTLESPLLLERSVAKNLQGSAYPMTITIGNVDSSYAGAYQDIISVDVSPQ